MSTTPSNRLAIRVVQSFFRQSSWARGRRMQTNFISVYSSNNPRSPEKMLQATAAVPRQSETFDLSSFRSSLQPRRAITCVLITIAVICLCVIAIACIVVVREFTMSLMYRKSVCTLNNITYAEKEETCRYCSGYVDKSKEGKTEACVPIPFPCVQNLVTFTDQTDTSVQKAMLYSDTNQASGTLRHVCIQNK